MGRHIPETASVSVGAVEALRRVASRHRRIDVYVFGSSLRGDTVAYDLDVLAIYPDLTALSLFTGDVHDEPLLSATIDLTAMLAEEFEHTEFVRRSAAVRLDELPQPQDRGQPSP